MALLLTVATGAWAQDPDPIDLTPSADGTVWTLSTMPEYDVELEVTYYTDAELDQMAADEVIAKITAIGTVTYTPESKALIDAARTAYDALTAAQQALVTNYSTLTDAETTYATAEETAYTEGVELTKNPDGTWSLAATPAFDVELEVEYETALALNETTDNSAALTEWNGYEADVTLTRTLSAGSWNTFAVPFNVDATMLAYLKAQYGLEVKELTGSSFENRRLTLTFADATEMKAGTPYLVKVTSDYDFSAQAFPNTEISKALNPVETTCADFIPTLGKTTITGDDAENVLFLDESNKLLKATELPADINGFRAYFLADLPAASEPQTGVHLAVCRINLGNDEALTGTFLQKGDVNADGSVTPADAIMILYHYFNVVQNGFFPEVADMNDDNDITPADAIEALYKYFESTDESSNGNARSDRPTTNGGQEPE